MAAARWDIVIEEGSQFDLYVTIHDSQCSPKDITGYGARFEIRAEKDSESTVLYEAETGGSGITVQPGGEAGLLHIQLTVAQVDAPGAAWTKGWHDLLVWPADGSITSKAKRHIEGRAEWSPAVTRAAV